MAQRLPLVVILGSTGSGKTKLSIELAQKFKGEIISADSMQVYKGLDIITAKATNEEQSVAPHHLIDILEPHETFTVLQYRNMALQTINNLINKNKLPIVVGGTNYYIESLLWKILIEKPGDHVKALPDTVYRIHELSSQELHKKLQILDPNMARRLHPNNKRKILRSLEVLQQQGKKHSEIIEEQQKSEGGSKSGGPLRFSNAIIFLLECEKGILDERLNKRVDKMVEQGLVQELTNFHNLYNENRLTNSELDYTKGVFQSIGFKEFHSYLIMNEEEKNSEKGRQELEKCIEYLKLVTRRYAKKQAKWTTNRFLGRQDREVPPMYGLDVTDVAKWQENVFQPAIEIIQSFISQSDCKYKPLPMQPVSSTPNTEDDTFYCETCDRVFIGLHQWSEHLGSNNHKRMKERKNKLSKKEQEVVKQT